MKQCGSDSNIQPIRVTLTLTFDLSARKLGLQLCRFEVSMTFCSVPIGPSKTQFTMKKVLFIHKLWPTPLPTKPVIPNLLYTSLTAPTYVYAHCLFRLVFYLLFQLHIIAIWLSGRIFGCY